MNKITHGLPPGSAEIMKRWIDTLLFLCMVLIGCPVAAIFAQTSSSQPADSITISGTVRDTAGRPVAGATVFLDEKRGSTSVQTKTNSDGSFTLSANHAGTYTVRAEKSRLRSRSTEPLLLAAAETKHLDLVLEPESSAETMEFQDEPDFKVAGVTDWSNVGLHGSDTTSRTSEALAKETSALKSGDAEKAHAINPHGKYQVALECEAKGDLAQARKEVQKILATSDDAEGHHLLGDFDERLNDPLDAVREYERAARMNGSEQNYFDWGTELLLHKAAQPAVEVFTEANRLHLSSPRMLAGLGAALYAVGSYDDAAMRVCEASDLRPADPAPYLFLGQMEKTVPAPLPCGDERLARFVQEQPANAMANYYYALALWKRQRGSETQAASRKIEELLEKAVRLKPNLGEAYVQLGALYFAQNSLTQAIQAYEHAVKVSPQLSDAHYRLSLAYKRAGNDAKAHQEFEAYQQAEKTETQAVEQQRRDLKQFLIILRSQPTSTPQ